MSDDTNPSQTHTLPDLEQMLTISELAEYLRVPTKTVYRWNTEGVAPPRIHVGKHLLYPVSGVQRWLDARTVGSAS